ncbi:hypothetical protein [Bradyrhizobium sp. LMTR 3]|uniref:hypothetical protein n=1 Tax=Bradyrhizobium sp. LMTR 3 TaxID=189873 RepID=UPI00159F031B|nr:hypothetical protein [Bradyrhizobium sp. LMTR 3]
MASVDSAFVTKSEKPKWRCLPSSAWIESHIFIRVNIVRNTIFWFQFFPAKPLLHFRVQNLRNRAGILRETHRYCDHRRRPRRFDRGRHARARGASGPSHSTSASGKISGNEQLGRFYPTRIADSVRHSATTAKN